MITPAYFCIDDFNGEAPEDGIEENELNIAVYPNPTNGILNIKIDYSNDYNYLITNSIGQNIISGIGNVSELHLDLSQFENGVYFITVVTENHKFVEKFIKK